MGLDMYLYEKEYLSPYSSPDRYNAVVEATGHGKTTEETDKHFLHEGKTPRYVIYEVGYWRKANHIHQWFVDNVQSGTDDCGTYYVTKEKLEELRDLCQQVLDSSDLIDGEVQNGYTFVNGKRVDHVEAGKIVADPTMAETLLPTTSGFFFGGTGYDQWYYQDVEDTIKIIDKALDTDDKFPEFEYHSSW